MKDVERRPRSFAQHHKINNNKGFSGRGGEGRGGERREAMESRAFCDLRNFDLATRVQCRSTRVTRAQPPNTKYEGTRSASF